MEITIETNSYNHRRYSKPWIATVDFSSSPKGDFSWGNFLGGDPGDEGMLTINANPGDIVANGQRDNRGGNTEVSYNYVTTDGKLSYLGNKADAYKHYTETKTATPDLDTLRKGINIPLLRDLHATLQCIAAGGSDRAEALDGFSANYAQECLDMLDKAIDFIEN